MLCSRLWVGRQMQNSFLTTSKAVTRSFVQFHALYRPGKQTDFVGTTNPWAGRRRKSSQTFEPGHQSSVAKETQDTSIQTLVNKALRKHGLLEHIDVTTEMLDRFSDSGNMTWASMKRPRKGKIFFPNGFAALDFFTDALRVRNAKLTQREDGLTFKLPREEPITINERDPALALQKLLLTLLRSHIILTDDLCTVGSLVHGKTPPIFPVISKDSTLPTELMPFLVQLEGSATRLPYTRVSIPGLPAMIFFGHALEAEHNFTVCLIRLELKRRHLLLETKEETTAFEQLTFHNRAFALDNLENALLVLGGSYRETVSQTQTEIEWSLPTLGSLISVGNTLANTKQDVLNQLGSTEKIVIDDLESRLAKRAERAERNKAFVKRPFKRRTPLSKLAPILPLQRKIGENLHPNYPFKMPNERTGYDFLLAYIRQISSCNIISLGDKVCIKLKYPGYKEISVEGRTLLEAAKKIFEQAREAGIVFIDSDTQFMTGSNVKGTIPNEFPIKIESDETWDPQLSVYLTTVISRITKTTYLRLSIPGVPNMYLEGGRGRRWNKAVVQAVIQELMKRKLVYLNELPKEWQTNKETQKKEDNKIYNVGTAVNKSNFATASKGEMEEATGAMGLQRVANEILHPNFPLKVPNEHTAYDFLPARLKSSGIYNQVFDGEQITIEWKCPGYETSTVTGKTLVEAVKAVYNIAKSTGIVSIDKNMEYFIDLNAQGTVPEEFPITILSNEVLDPRISRYIEYFNGRVTKSGYTKIRIPGVPNLVFNGTAHPKWNKRTIVAIIKELEKRRLVVV